MKKGQTVNYRIIKKTDGIGLCQSGTSCNGSLQKLGETTGSCPIITTFARGLTCKLRSPD